MKTSNRFGPTSFSVRLLLSGVVMSCSFSSPARAPAAEFGPHLVPAAPTLRAIAAPSMPRCAGDLDPGFVPALRDWDGISVIVRQADGRWLVGGERLARLEADGALDPAFPLEPVTAVHALLLQPDGKILVGGYRGLGESSLSLIRLNADGSTDATFNLGAQPSGVVHALAIQPDGKTWIGGLFDAVDGVARHGVARLQADGTLDPEVNLPAWRVQSLSAIVVQPDGRVLLAGWFNLDEDGESGTGVVRLLEDGSLDPSFDLRVNGGAEQLALQPDGKLTVCGWFGYAGETRRDGLARFNADGSFDPTFNPSAGDYGVRFYNPRTIALASNGQVYVGAWYMETAYPWHGHSGVLRLNANGSRDLAFETDLMTYDPDARDAYAKCIVPLADGSVMAGGYFDFVNGVEHHHLARLDGDSHGCPGFIATGSHTHYEQENNGTLRMPLNRVGGTNGNLAVNFATRDGDAQAGSDFGASSGTVVFGPGERHKTIVLPLLNDTLVESNEWFTLTLSAPAGARSFRSETSLDRRVVIIDDESFGRPGSIDPTFEPDVGGHVACVARQPDGKLIIAGTLMDRNGRELHVARLSSHGSLDSHFNAPRVDDFPFVYAVALQPDGKAVIAGAFTRVGGIPRGGIARLNADGSLDASFNPGAGVVAGETQYRINQLLLQPDGRILLAGHFPSVNGVQRYSIARLNADGSLDTSFNPTPGLTSPQGSFAWLTSLVLQPDGRILVGGLFDWANGAAADCIARLNPDGSTDTTFHQGLGLNSECMAIALQPNGMLIVSGYFSYQPGIPEKHLARLNPDGTVDPGFQADTQSNRAYDIDVQPDGRVLLVGPSLTVNGVACSTIARLHPDGALDFTFNPGAGAWSYEPETGCLLLPDGDVLVFGWFSEFNRLPYAGLVRLLGEFDEPPRIGTPPVSRTKCVGQDTTFTVRAWSERPLSYRWLFNGVPIPGATAETFTLTDLRLPQAGVYTVVVTDDRGASTKAEATLTVVAVPTGPAALDYAYALGEGVDPAYHYSVVQALALQPDGKVLLGGEFTQVHGVTRYLIARLNLDGSLDSSFDAGDALGTEDYSISAMALQPDGRVLVGGSIYGSLRRLLPDGCVDATFNYNAYNPIHAHAIVVEPDGKILIGGNCGVSRLETNGVVDSVFQQIPCDPGSVHAIVRQPDGKILIGGEFWRLAGLPRVSVARLNADGSLDASFQPLPGTNSRAFALVLQPDGKVIVGSEILGSEFIPPSHVARLNADGTPDANFSSALAFRWIRALALQPDGKVLVGHYYGVSRLNPDGSLDPGVGGGAVTDSELEGDDCFQPGVHALVLQPDGAIVIGGGFRYVNGMPRNFIARLEGDSPPDLVPPRIVQHPENQRVSIGADVTFAVVAEGTEPLTYQWAFNDDSIPGATNATLTLTHVQVRHGGYYEVYVRNAAGWAHSEATLEVIFTLADALDAPGLVWRTEETDPWYPQTEVTHDGVDAAALSMCDDCGSTALETEITGPGVIRFWWKISSTPLDDRLTFQMDGSQLAEVTGVVDWERHAFVVPEGIHALQWTYTTGDNGPDGPNSAWLDEVSFTPSTPGSLDPSFDITAGGRRIGITGSDAAIQTIVEQPDGEILIGGNFVGVGGVPRFHLARLHSDGRVDTSFDAGLGPNDYVTVIACAPDGKVLVGGAFTNVSGVPRQHLARLHANGALDLGFHADLNINSPLYFRGLAVQNDGKVLVAGWFTRVNGVACTNLARLNPDGSLDPTFNPHAHFAGKVSASRLKLQPDGKIVVTGSFGPSQLRLVRLNPDGSPDPAFHFQANADWQNASIFVMDVQPDDKIVMGGLKLARFNTDGSLDTTFNVSTSGSSPVDSLIKAMAFQPDGRIVIGGDFRRVAGVSRRQLARLNADGSLDVGFDPGNAVGQVEGPTSGVVHYPNVNALLAPANDRVLVGTQRVLRRELTQSLIQLTADGSRDPEFAVAIEADAGETVTGVFAVAPQLAGKVLIGGNFTHVNSVPSPSVARLNPDGTLDTTFHVSDELGPITLALAVQSDGMLLVGGGAGTTITRPSDPPPRHALARLLPDGALDPSFDPGSGPWGDPLVRTIVPQPDGKILVGGDFSRFNQQTNTSALVRLNPDGSVDTAFVPPLIRVGDDWGVYTIALQPDGKILIGGSWAGDLPSPLARLNPDGSVDASYHPDIYGSIYSMRRFADGRLLFAGSFTTVNGVPRRGLARLNADGTLDPGFVPDAALPCCFQVVTLQPDGKILAATGWSGSGVVRLHPDGRLDPTFTNQAQAVLALALAPNGRVFIGGTFTSVNGLPVRKLARLNNDLVIPAPFVERRIVERQVQLLVTPPSGIHAYAVEDRPPAGWRVDDITDEGLFDPMTGKVKFGPFFASEPRILRYAVTPPPGAQGVFTFTGTASADGVNTAIVGEDRIVLPWPHPADCTPCDWAMRIEEITAYGAAWRRGLNWIVPPYVIPIDYITRAAFLWRGGECYTVDSEATNAPLWWVPCEGGPALVPDHGQAGSPSHFGATRSVPPAFVPGEPITITISANPDNDVRAYAVEDALPAGWTVLVCSHDGEFDTVSRKVKWGPFLDRTARTLSYLATSPADASSPVNLAGTASLDGTSLAIVGPGLLQPGSRLVMKRGPQGKWILSLAGRDGAQCVIETSSDLSAWTPVAEATVAGGHAVVTIPENPLEPQRFYRARLIQ